MSSPPKPLAISKPTPRRHFRSPTKSHPKPFTRKCSPLSRSHKILTSNQERSTQQANPFYESPGKENITPASKTATKPITLKPGDKFEDILQKVEPHFSSPLRIPFYISTSCIFPLVADAVIRKMKGEDPQITEDVSTLPIADVEHSDSNLSVSPVASPEEQTKQETDTSQTEITWPDLPQILSEKQEFKSEMIHADLLEIYKALVDFMEEKKDLMLVYQKLYGVFLVHKKKPKIEERKTILNNLNYKIKSLRNIYPHLTYYGNSSMFTFRTVVRVPEILLVRENEELKKRFEQAQSLPVPNRITSK